MDYVKTPIKEEIVVRKIVTVHYFEYAKDYVFEGEKHDFWEFLFVDKGEVEVMADAFGYRLKQGQIIFHKPNEFHNVWANGIIAPNLIVVSFECKSRALDYFKGKILSIDDTGRNLLAQIISEAKDAYISPLNDPELKKLQKRAKSLFGCEQLIRIYLEQLLIYLVRKGENNKYTGKPSSSVKERAEKDIAAKISAYLDENVENNITFKEVCSYSLLSPTRLKSIFKEKTGTSVMEYYKNLKIEEAKRMIRESPYNFTQISEILGYSSIHYFSRHFKKATDMSPSQYASSVKAKILP